MSLRVLIVDDEPPARAGLIQLLADSLGDAELREADNGLDALRLLHEWRPQLLFLDVKMPGLSGLAVMREMQEHERPVTVFVTAYREHAVEAFDVAAVDYLVKPFRRTRFALCLERVQQRLNELHQGSRFQNAGHHTGPPLRFRDGNRTLFIHPTALFWVGGAGNYVELHTESGVQLIRTTMKGMEELLPSDMFCRIHRSILVNRRAVCQITGTEHGDFEVTLTTGEKVPLSRHRRDAVVALLNQHFT